MLKSFAFIIHCLYEDQTQASVSISYQLNLEPLPLLQLVSRTFPPHLYREILGQPGIYWGQLGDVSVVSIRVIWIWELKGPRWLPFQTHFLVGWLSKHCLTSRVLALSIGEQSDKNHSWHSVTSCSHLKIQAFPSPVSHGYPGNNPASHPGSALPLWPSTFSTQ